MKADLITEADIDDVADCLEQSIQVMSTGCSIGVGISVRPFSGGSSLHIPDFLKKVYYGVTVVIDEDNFWGLRCIVLAKYRR